MRATLINRKRLIKCIITRFILFDVNTCDTFGTLRLICTEDELRNPRAVLDIYDRIYSNEGYVISKEGVKNLLKELEFKNMSNDNFEKLLKYCRYIACEFVYSNMGKCPYCYSSRGENTNNIEDLERFKKEHRPRILKIIKETKDIIPHVVGDEKYKDLVTL